ncbi:putative reovirus sigma C capsid domain protein [Rhizoctonia solani 123E]|uniref:Putative reovirus sigma C capsid domain protein n=1 Tax=Rhizoctonia solani 123E TaxID=1423351 RepID=A0A074RLC9_9AGAM|nr:putative reovirus sigma C capsid domain protein [Rhizoctonia solani 123E]
MAAIVFSQEDSDQFIQAAINELDQDDGKLANNVSKVADWAVQVDEGFANVTYGLQNMYDKHGEDFPDLGTYNKEWKGYKEQWTAHLLLSRNIASKHAADLHRFNQVFLSMIQDIQTDQDREDVIAELGEFAKEDHTESADMAQRFKALKADIGGFLVRFEQWIQDTGTKLKQEAYDLSQAINKLEEKIKELDEEIVMATLALLASAAAAGTMIGVIELIVAGTTLAALLISRIEKTLDLSQKQKDLADVNRKQQALAQIKTQFDGLKPDIALICSKLALFGDIWASIQGQTLHFQQTLRRGMEALTDSRFKKEIELARKLCTPLRNGLEIYATQLGSRS